MRKHILTQTILLTLGSAVLTGCGGGGTTTASTTPSPAPASKPITGTAVAPETPNATVQAASLGSKLRIAANSQCTNVPDGYVPLASATVALLDDQGNDVGASATTDACGNFTIDTPPANGAQVKIKGSSEYKEIIIPVASLDDKDGDGKNDPVSTLPAASTLEITGLTNPTNSSISLVVTDSITHKAILGVPVSAFTIKDGPNNIGIKSATYSATASQDPAVVSLVLDASGSMGVPVPPDYNKTRLEVAAEAAKLFVNRMDPKDQAEIIAFDHKVLPLHKSSLEYLKFSLVDDKNLPISLPEGFTSDKTSLNLLIDFYNYYSSIWDPTSQGPHVIGGYYPLGGATAVWDATHTGVYIASKEQGRRFVITMTDGDDNASSYKPSQVASYSKSNNTIIHTVGIGDQYSVNKDDLEKLAKESGGTFTLVDSNNAANQLATTFDAIRTAIKFQYLVETSQPLTTGSTINIEVSYLGLTGQSSFTAK